MLTVLWHYLLVLGSTAALWPAVTLVLAGGHHGNPKSIAAVGRMRAVPAKLPATALFSCRGGKVSITVVDRTARAEKTIEAWQQVGFLSKISLLTWNGPPKSVSRVRARLTVELVLRSLAFPLFVVLPIAAAVWLAFTAHWLWICAVVVVAAGVVCTAFTGKLLVIKPTRLAGAVSSLFWGSLLFRWLADSMGADWLYDWFNYLGGMSADWHDRIVPVVVSFTVMFAISAVVFVLFAEHE